MEFTIAPLRWKEYSEKTLYAAGVGPDFTIGTEETILGPIVTLRRAEELPCYPKVETQFKTVEEAKERAQIWHDTDLKAFLIPSTAKETVLRDIRTLIDSLMLPGDEPENKSML